MGTNTETVVDVTGVEREMIRAAYDLSSPQGLGFLHAKPGGLTDVEVDGIIARGGGRVSMDYVNGRAVKLSAMRREGYGERVFIYADRWYDHGRDQLDELLRRIGRDGAEHRVEITTNYED